MNADHPFRKTTSSPMVHSTSLLLPRNPVKNVHLFSVFGGIHGLTISREPNQTTIAFAGSNVTLSWNLILTPKEKIELLEVWFGTWNTNYKMIGTILKKIATTNGSINDATDYTQKAKRWNWNGDISRNYTIAYQLTNAHHDDAGDYGIRARADTWPPGMESKGPFSLAIKVGHSSVKKRRFSLFSKSEWCPFSQPRSKGHYQSFCHCSVLCSS